MNPFEELYKELRKKYGVPAGQWALWCKRPKNQAEREEVIIEAILTQRTNWQNVVLAVKNLEKAKAKSLEAVLQLTTAQFASLIKPAGFYQTKALYLSLLAEFILKTYGGLEQIMREETEKLRKELLDLKGIGPETADSILLYALDKPVFVIDEYTRRLVKKRGLTNNFSYNFLQTIFEKHLKKDYGLYQDFHALIVIDGKNAKR